MEDTKHLLLKTTLKKHGYSLTGPRRGVFDLLDQKEPQSMNDLIKKSRSKLDRASLYRTVKLFEGLGVINRINIGFKYKIELGSSFSHHHHHLSCTNCGRIIDVEEDNRLEIIIKELALKHKFSPASHQLEIEGLCEVCKPSSPKSLS